jgi:hypothetical protein
MSKKLTPQQNSYKSKGKKFNDWKWLSKNTLAGKTVYSPNPNK